MGLLALTMVMAFNSAAAAAAPTGPRRIVGRTASRLLKGAPMAEYRRLPVHARANAKRQLDQAHVMDADMDALHFDAAGRIIFADAFSGDAIPPPQRHRRDDAEQQWPDKQDEHAFFPARSGGQQAQRSRRALSNEPPASYLPNGVPFRRRSGRSLIA